MERGVDALLGSLAGTVWIDTELWQVVRLEARFVKTFKTGGGLFARVAPSSYAIFEQRLVDDRVWLPAYREVNVSARVFLFGTVEEYVIRRYAGYTRYQVGADYTIDSDCRDDSAPE